MAIATFKVGTRRTIFSFYLFIVIYLVGLALLGLGTGVSALRSATLPKWLGWVSVAFGVLALAGPAGGIAFLVAPAWALVIGIVIMRSPRAAATLADPAAQDAPEQWVTGSH